MPGQITPKEHLIPVGCGNCHGVVNAYDTRSHEACCPSCGITTGRMSTPLEYFERVRALVDACATLVSKGNEDPALVKALNAMLGG